MRTKIELEIDNELKHCLAAISAAGQTPSQVFKRALKAEAARLGIKKNAPSGAENFLPKGGCVDGGIGRHRNVRTTHD